MSEICACGCVRLRGYGVYIDDDAIAHTPIQCGGYEVRVMRGGGQPVEVVQHAPVLPHPDCPLCGPASTHSVKRP